MLAAGLGHRAAAARGINPGVPAAAPRPANAKRSCYCRDPTRVGKEDPEESTCCLPPGRKGAPPPLQVEQDALLGATSGKPPPYRTAAPFLRSGGGAGRNQASWTGTGQRDAINPRNHRPRSPAGRRSYLSEVTRQLARRKEDGLEPLGGLVGAESEQEAGEHGR